MTQIAAAGIVLDLEYDIAASTKMLSSLAERWQTAIPAAADWESELRLRLQGLSGYRSFEWLDPSMRVQRILQVRDDGASYRRTPQAEARLTAAINAARQKRALVFSHSFEFTDGSKGLLICVPVLHDDALKGSIIATLVLEEMLADLHRDHAALGFATAIFEGNDRIFLYPKDEREYESRTWEQSVTLRLPGMNWQVRVQPLPGLIVQIRRGWDEAAILLFGVALSLMLKITVSQSQTATRQANMITVANRQLEKVVREHERTEASLLASKARLAGILEMAAEGIITVNEKQDITLFNKGAEQIFGYEADMVLGKPLEMLIPERYRPVHSEHVIAFGASGGATRPMNAVRLVSGLRKNGQEFPAHASVTMLEVDGEKLFTVVLRDVSEAVRAEMALRKAHDELEERVQERTAELTDTNEKLRAEIAERRQAQEMLEKLSCRLLNLQDDERRRIARELHDSTGQLLAAVSIGINKAQRESSKLSATAREALVSCAASIEECLHGIRNLSYLLHPPLLEEMGLVGALSSLADGFQQRSGIHVNLEVPPDFGRLPLEAEIAFYRIVQESLTNVYRHSGSPNATIKLSSNTNSREVVLEVTDQGGVIPDRIPNPDDVQDLGVGIAGMRARMKQLGGCLELISRPSGTTVRASLTLPAGSLDAQATA